MRGERCQVTRRESAERTQFHTASRWCWRDKRLRGFRVSKRAAQCQEMSGRAAVDGACPEPVEGLIAGESGRTVRCPAGEMGISSGRDAPTLWKIGRASCRERVETAER